jgi:hypothetical protein
MSKKIPIKVKKSKPSVTSAREADERYWYAKALFDVQDEPTRKVVLRLIDQMQRMVENPSEMHHKNFLWIAMRMLAALARMDIQVENFTPVERHCIECGKRVERATRKPILRRRNRALS